MLGLLRRVSLVLCLCLQSALCIYLFCSSLWYPYLLMDIKCLEYVQKRATKFICNDHLLDYRNRSLHLNLFPLMIEFEITDIMLLVKSIKFPSDHFPIYKFVEFCSHLTRTGHSFKLKHSLCRNNIELSYYFNCIPRL